MLIASNLVVKLDVACLKIAVDKIVIDKLKAVPADRRYILGDRYI